MTTQRTPPSDDAIELAEIRVENILGPWRSEMSIEIIAERIVQAVVEEVCGDA